MKEKYLVELHICKNRLVPLHTCDYGSIRTFVQQLLQHALLMDGRHSAHVFGIEGWLHWFLRRKKNESQYHLGLKIKNGKNRPTDAFMWSASIESSSPLSKCECSTPWCSGKKNYNFYLFFFRNI